MKVKCIYHDLVQDKYDASVFYEPNEVYDVTKERAAELIASCYFEEVKEQWAVIEEDDGVHVRPVVDNEVIDTPIEKVIKPKKSVKKSAK